MQKVFNLTNKYMILLTPLILYSMFSSIYLAFSIHGKLINIIFALILFTLMTAAFLAGWLNMVKKAVLDDQKDDPNYLIKIFPESVGEYFLPSLGAIINVFIIFLTGLALSAVIGMNLIGDPGVTPEALSKAMTNTAELKNFVANLSPEQIIKINQWDFLVLGIMCFNYLILFLYFPAIFFKTKNPYKAFWYSLKDLFSKKFLKTLAIFFLVIFIHMLVSVSSTLFSANSILYFVITLLNFYFITAISIGIFYYYNQEFIDQHLGQNIDIQI